VIDDCYLKELLAICNEEHTDGRARVTMDEERVYSKTLMIPDDSTTPDDVVLCRSTTFTCKLPCRAGGVRFRAQCEHRLRHHL